MFLGECATRGSRQWGLVTPTGWRNAQRTRDTPSRDDHHRRARGCFPNSGDPHRLPCGIALLPRHGLRPLRPEQLLRPTCFMGFSSKVLGVRHIKKSKGYPDLSF